MIVFTKLAVNTVNVCNVLRFNRNNDFLYLVSYHCRRLTYIFSMISAKSSFMLSVSVSLLLLFGGCKHFACAASWFNIFLFMVQRRLVVNDINVFVVNWMNQFMDIFTIFYSYAVWTCRISDVHLMHNIIFSSAS